MSATTTRTSIAIRFDILFGGVVVRECCDDDLGARLHLFGPSCACDLRTVEVRFPVKVDRNYEPRTYDYPGCNDTDITLDRSEGATIRVADEDGAPLSSLLPETARELFDAMLNWSESMEMSLV